MIGGVLGIIMGVLAGNLLVLLLHSSFVMPWLWIILGLAFTSVIGILAGLYPAILASNLNPVEALRYE
jgi:putative ABC transport system permease protein